MLQAGHIPCADPEVRSIAGLRIHTDRDGIEVLVVGAVDPLVPGGQQLGSIGQCILYAETPVVPITIVEGAVDDPAVDGSVAILSVSGDDPKAVDPVNAVEIEVTPETEGVGVLVEGG